MADIKYTYTLDLVSEKPEDRILDDPILLKKVAEFYNTHAEILTTIANCLNEPDAKKLIQHAIDEETFVLRGQMVGRESFVTGLMKYSAEQARRDEEAKKKSEENPQEEESLPTADEELTLESPPKEEA